MFFKNLLNGTAELLDIKYQSSLRDGINSADIGELCEIFIKEFLTNCLDDYYKIFRGGNIVNTIGNCSPQLDIVLTNKNTLKIFGDKGIYPIETVIGVFSITSNLTLPKLEKCMIELSKIPKHHYGFHMERFYGEKFKTDTNEVWENSVPFSCIFGFKGNIKEQWIDKINKHAEMILDHSLLPSIIVVNKKGFIEKSIMKDENGNINFWFEFVPLNTKDTYGYYLSKILFHLYNLSGEQYFRRPNYHKYFERDY
jgi:hypothetical protein